MTVKAAGLQALIKGADVKEAVSDPSIAGQTVQLRPSGDRSRDQRSATSLGSRSACWQVDPPHGLGSSLPPFAPAVPTTADVLDGSCTQVPRPPVKDRPEATFPAGTADTWTHLCYSSVGGAYLLRSEGCGQLQIAEPLCRCLW